jgi:hypothetical protein
LAFDSARTTSVSSVSRKTARWIRVLPVFWVLSSWARRRLRGVRLVATDVEWTAGSGAEVTGPIDALLLLLTGRVAAALPRLTGPACRA